MTYVCVCVCVSVRGCLGGRTWGGGSGCSGGSDAAAVELKASQVRRKTLREVAPSDPPAIPAGRGEREDAQ